MRMGEEGQGWLPDAESMVAVQQAGDVPCLACSPALPWTIWVDYLNGPNDSEKADFLQQISANGDVQADVNALALEESKAPWLQCRW